MVIKFTYNGGPIKDTTAIRARSKWQRENQWDMTTSPDRQLPTNTKYIIIDLQTHNCKHGNHQVHTGRVVEVAWILCDADGTMLETKQYLLKPYGGGYEQITESATKVHGITTACVNEYGSDAHLVFDELIKAVRLVPQDGFVVVHDMDVKHSIMRNSLTPEQREVWDGAPKCNISAKSLLKHLPPDVKRKYCNFKNIKRALTLPEMLRNIGQSTSGDVYDVRIATLDAKWTWDIFMYYKEYAEYAELEWREVFFGPSKYPGIMMTVSPSPLLHRVKRRRRN